MKQELAGPTHGHPWRRTSTLEGYDIHVRTYTHGGISLPPLSLPIVENHLSVTVMYSRWHLLAT